jgi:hypothetical protein
LTLSNDSEWRRVSGFEILYLPQVAMSTR